MIGNELAGALALALEDTSSSTSLIIGEGPEGAERFDAAVTAGSAHQAIMSGYRILVLAHFGHGLLQYVRTFRKKCADSWLILAWIFFLGH
jgi:hypothetical protein